MVNTSTEGGFYKVQVTETTDAVKAAATLSYAAEVQAVRDVFNSGKTRELSWRRQQISQIIKLFKENKDAIAQAILDDHHGPSMRGMAELSPMLEGPMVLENLEKWVAPETVGHPTKEGKSYVMKQPKGVILNIAPWNFPIALVFSAMLGMIAAGNCVIIKPSEVSENSCKLLVELIPKYLDNDCFKVITGGVAETTALLREQFDHIMYTGNGAVGRIVMAAAAKHLTPVTLELGGKSPVYVDKSADLDATAESVVGSKTLNVGQICIAADYLLVHEEVADKFKDILVKTVQSTLGKSTEDRKKNSAFGRIINSRHVERIKDIVSSSSGKVLLGGASDAADHFFDATIIDEPSANDKILKEELFAPVIPIVKVKSLDEAVKKVNEICAKPLALYIFTKDEAAATEFISKTTSGGVSVNGVAKHYGNHELPFGGIGESGMGHYHGKWGFNEFTHMRAVFVAHM